MSMEVLADAHDFTITNPNFIDKSRTTNNINSQTINHIASQAVDNGGTSGFRILLEASIPSALYDSSARYPPPLCHPGTRKEYIDKITSWGLNSDGRVGRILWMHGPAGVGKSAVAQSCAEAMAHKLGATFFFSSSNSRDNPNCFFTTISYQLATKIDSYGSIIDNKIRRDPTLVEKSIKQQFQELLVAPLRELRLKGETIDELVIVVDGLDECKDPDAQCDIVDIIVASVRARSTPFLWIFVSRPEPHIVASFTSDDVPSLSLHVELPVSRAIDSEILLYLTDELEKVRKRSDLPPSWLSEKDIWTLVDLSAGLFIYAATVVRFIGEYHSSGPEDRLRAVLALATRSAKDGSSKHPLSKLDIFYTLIMQGVPSEVIFTVRKILLIKSFSWTNANDAANLLGLSESQFRNAIRALHSVLRLDHKPKPDVFFYHASFMEYLQDPMRAKEFCIRTDCAVDLRRGILSMLNRIHANSSSPESIDIPITWPGARRQMYNGILEIFFTLCQSIALEPEMVTALAQFGYAMIPVLWKEGGHFVAEELNGETFLENIPKNFRQKILRPYPQIFFHPDLLVKPLRASWSRPYVLGHGKNRALCWSRNGSGSVIDHYPSRREMLVKLLKSKIMGFLKNTSQVPSESED